MPGILGAIVQSQAAADMAAVMSIMQAVDGKPLPLKAGDMPDVQPMPKGPPAPAEVPDVVLDPQCFYYRIADHILAEGGPEWALFAERVRYAPILSPKGAWFTLAEGNTRFDIDRHVDHYLSDNHHHHYKSKLVAYLFAAINNMSFGRMIEGSMWWQDWYSHGCYGDDLRPATANAVLPPLPTKQWEVRELLRIANGEYFALPWADDVDAIPRHYAHISTVDPTMVSFTPDDQKGAADRQVRMKPGRYLSKFYPDMDPDDVRKYAAMLDASCTELHLAHTPDEIEHVYVNGPSSCMSYPASSFSSPEHPVRIYGAGDLAVAYTKRPDGKIMGRCLVWPAKKKRGRIYGDIDRMKLLLKANGYDEHEDDLRGAKLLRIKAGNGFVMPYIDNAGCFDDDGTHLYIGDDFDAQLTNGLSQAGTYCPRLDDYVDDDEDDFTYIHDVGENWSPTAVDRYAWFCDYLGNCYSDDCPSHEVRVRRTTRNGRVFWDTEYWHSDALEVAAWYCEATDQWYSSDVEGAVVVGYDSPVCPEWAADNCTACAVSGDLYETCELVENKAGDLVHPDHLDDDDAEADTAAAA